MKRILFLALAFALGLSVAVYPSHVQALDPLALVTGVSLSNGTVIIRGTLPCAKWTAYAVTSVGADRVDITVYRRAKSVNSCAAVVKPYVVSVTPTLINGIKYSVYVNGQFRFYMRK